MNLKQDTQEWLNAAAAAENLEQGIAQDERIWLLDTISWLQHTVNNFDPATIKQKLQERLDFLRTNLAANLRAHIAEIRQDI